MRKLLLLAVLAAGAAGCASAQAKATAAHVNLEVPPVPPRVIEALPMEAPAPEPAEELPPVAAVAPRPKPSPPPAPREARGETRPAETPAVEPAPPAAAPPAAAPAPQLRTPGTLDGAEAARQILEIVERARRTLASIDYRRLSAERRSQYDGARLMASQAEDAVKASNFEFARNLADKADRLATELRGR